jgi:hypothetical protein
VSDEEIPMITPPPGLAIPASQQPEPVTDAASPDPQAFITLPPGVFDSGTYRVPNPRVVPPRTHQSDDIVFFPSAPGVPAAPGVAPVEQQPAASIPQWRLVLPGGIGAKAVDGAVFIGRNPARRPEWPNAELLPLVDPAKSLSKTHALVELEQNVLWVHDLDSTNGVFIVTDNGDATEVVPGSRAAVPAGSDLELGDYVIRVECD